MAAGVTPADVTSTLGSAYLDEGRVDDATKMLTTAVQAAPTRPDLRVALARAYRLGGRLAEAEQQLAQALPPGANREASEFYETVEADIHLETGLIRIAQKRDDEAVKELTQALALRPIARAHTSASRRAVSAAGTAGAGDDTRDRRARCGRSVA